MAAGKEEGTCSVCLRRMQLRGDSPIRHGFHAIGVRHGANTGHHTGPCSGTQYPHLGLSDAGTKWARGIAKQRLANIEKWIDDLGGNPPLMWYPTSRGKMDLAKGVEIKHGDVTGWPHTDGRPSYVWMHKQKLTAAELDKDQLVRTIDAYDKVIDNYDPAKYPTTGAPVKEKTMHLGREYTHPRFGTWEGPTCRFVRGKVPAMKFAMTRDPAKVTCGPCKKKIGLP